VCGRGPQDGIRLEVDHITPVAAGGTDDLDNLRTLCRECNEGKSDRIYRPIKPTPTGEAGLPVPAEYAIYQVTQCLRHFELSTGQRELSIAQAFAVIQTPGISDGINPLFWPLPKDAILSALLALDQEGKVHLSDGQVEILEAERPERHRPADPRPRRREETKRKIDLAVEIIGVEPGLWLQQDETGGRWFDRTAVVQSGLRGTLRQLATLLGPEDETSKRDLTGYITWLDKISEGVRVENISATNLVGNVKRLQDSIERDLHRWKASERQGP